MMKRIISFLIIMSMLAAMAVSCSDNGNDTKSGSDSDSDRVSDTSDVETTVPETTESFDPELPERTYNDETFTILTKSVSTFTDWGEKSIWTESLTGDVLNDAVYARNLAVEEKFQIKIKEVQSGSMTNDISNSVMAADGAYDAALPPLNECGSLIINGHLMELNQLEYLNFEKSWWDQRSIEDLSIMNKLFMVSGDISTLNNDATWCTMINLGVLNNYNVQSPYELVRNNEWTYTKFYEICQGVSTDLNGDGIYDTNDLIANLTQNENATAMLIGAGIHLVSKDANGVPEFTLATNEKSFSALEIISTIMNNKEVSLNYHNYGAEGYHLATTKMFEEDRGLFWITNLQMVIRLREMNTDFGIAPVPKLDSDQKEYSNVVWQVGSFLCVPKTTNDKERTGIILEAMAAKSREVLRPAYYEVALSYKYLRDQDSLEMLDIIIDNRTYELEKAFNWEVTKTIESIVNSNAEATSTLTKMAKAINASINRTIKAVESYE